jgi:type II secretory pathway component PulK
MIMPCHYEHGARRRGAALIAVLWLGTLAAMMLLGVRRAASLSLATGYAELATVQSHWLARAGVEQAIAVLSDDYRDSDSWLDQWYDDEYWFRQIQLGPGAFSVIAPAEGQEPGAVRFGLVDHAGLLNVNVADEAQISALPAADAQIAASILDWRDTDSEARAGGAEAAYYSRLRLPYQVRNGSLHTVAELRLVKGVDPQVFEGDARTPGLRDQVTVWGRERNRSGNGGERVNMNSAGEQDLRVKLLFSEALARGVVSQRGNRQFQSLMDLLNVQPQQGGGSRAPAQAGAAQADDDQTVKSIDLDWLAKNLDLLTLSDDDFLPARININTAPREVLLTLPRITPEVADAMIGFRKSLGGPFYAVGDLRRVAGMTDDIFKAVAERCTVRSNVFAVTSVGSVPRGIRQRITAVIDRSEDPIRILYWHQSE